MDYAKQFERKERTADKWIYVLIGSAPDHLREFVRKVHNELGASFLNDWLSNSFAIGMCDEALTELGSDGKGMIDRISQGQWYTLDRIYNMVNDFLESRRLKDEE